MFTAILWEAMPFIVLGAVVAGILEEFLPQQLIGKVMPKAALPAVIVGALLGLIFPMCECGIVVVMRRLLRKGLPLACCVAYMLAGPIVNVIVLLSTYKAFQGHQVGVEMVVYRAGFGVLTAIVTGLVVHYLEKKNGIAKLVTALAAPPKVKGLAMVDEEAEIARQPFFTRLGNIATTSLHDFMDITVYLIMGAILAAMAKMFLEPGSVERMSQDMPFLAIPAMMLLAVLMCLCSEADAFVAASFTQMHMSAKLAFLVLGPMFDLKLLLMYTRVFKKKLIFTIVIVVVLQVYAYMALFHLAAEHYPRIIQW
ncbi:permease [soil metagenome]